MHERQRRALYDFEEEALRPDSLKVIQDLRAAGKVVEYSLTPAKGDKQFKRALELKAKQTVRLERAADGKLSARVRNLATREEKVCAPQELA